MHKGERIRFLKHHYGNRVGWNGETRADEERDLAGWLAGRDSGPGGDHGRQSSGLEGDKERNRQIQEI